MRNHHVALWTVVVLGASAAACGGNIGDIDFVGEQGGQNNGVGTGIPGTAGGPSTGLGGAAGSVDPGAPAGAAGVSSGQGGGTSTGQGGSSSLGGSSGQ